MFTGLFPPLGVTWWRQLGWSSFYSNGKLGWAGAVENSGKLRNQANRIEKKNRSRVMERVRTLNLSPVSQAYCRARPFSHLKTPQHY